MPSGQRTEATKEMPFKNEVFSSVNTVTAGVGMIRLLSGVCKGAVAEPVLSPTMTLADNTQKSLQRSMECFTAMMIGLQVISEQYLT